MGDFCRLPVYGIHLPEHRAIAVIHRQPVGRSPRTGWLCGLYIYLLLCFIRDRGNPSQDQGPIVAAIGRNCDNGRVVFCLWRIATLRVRTFSVSASRLAPGALFDRQSNFCGLHHPARHIGFACCGYPIPAGPASNAGAWAKVALWATILTIQMLGIIFTLSRGPWVGVMVALAVFLVMTTFFVGWRTSARGALVLALAALLTLLVLFTTPSPSATDRSATREVSERFTFIGRGVTVSGLGGRVEMWRVSGRFMLEHPWFGFDSLGLSNLRLIFGYGPEFFRGTYLLLSVPKQPNLVPWEPSQAHKYFITQGVELGFLGLLTSLGIFSAPVVVGVYVLFRKRADYSRIHKLMLIGLISTLAGRMVEQSVGLARVSDLTIFWVLLGAFIALPVVMDKIRAASSRLQIRPTSQWRRRSAGPTPRYSRAVWRLVVAVLLIGGIVSLTWMKSLNYVRAALEARTVNHSFLAGDFQSSLQALDRAIGLAPDVFVYYDHRAEIYSTYLDQNSKQRDRKCSLQEALSYQVCVAQQSYLNAQRAVDIRPFHYRSNLAFADKTLALAELSGDAALFNESIRLYERTLEMVPQSWKIKNRLARAHIQSKKVDEALPVLVESLAITRDSPFSSEALMLQGVAYRKLSRLEEAIMSLDQAIFYDVQRAEAYNNRGNVYQDLGQFNRAINDYSEAIRLNPQYARAFANRAIAYAQLGEDEKARQDADRSQRAIEGDGRR